MPLHSKHLFELVRIQIDKHRTSKATISQRQNGRTHPSGRLVCRSRRLGAPHSALLRLQRPLDAPLDGGGVDADGLLLRVLGHWSRQGSGAGRQVGAPAATRAALQTKPEWLLKCCCCTQLAASPELGMPVTCGDVAEKATSNRKRGSGVREEGVQEGVSACMGEGGGQGHRSWAGCGTNALQGARSPLSAHRLLRATAPQPRRARRCGRVDGAQRRGGAAEQLRRAAGSGGCPSGSWQQWRGGALLVPAAVRARKGEVGRRRVGARCVITGRGGASGGGLWHGCSGCPGGLCSAGNGATEDSDLTIHAARAAAITDSASQTCEHDRGRRRCRRRAAAVLLLLSSPAARRKAAQQPAPHDYPRHQRQLGLSFVGCRVRRSAGRWRWRRRRRRWRWQWSDWRALRESTADSPTRWKARRWELAPAALPRKLLFAASVLPAWKSEKRGPLRSRKPSSEMCQRLPSAAAR